MKSSIIIGILFLILGIALGYIQCNGSKEPILTITLVIGLLAGSGLGLILGAISGYSSKTQSIKRKARDAEREVMRNKIQNQDTPVNNNYSNGN
ncbi:MAG: hypothetical protein J6581_01755 [Apibacter sp.]|jgi:hypothetical protein|nr:hypothetical protein [Apibacter sp.]